MGCPPATDGRTNRVWEWRGQRVRYQSAGATNDGPCVLLVHGLFVNADHWRNNIGALADAGCRVFAIDLLGCGYSDKPDGCGPEAAALNGEKGRVLVPPPVAELGTARGGVRSRVPVEQRHPLGSAYNFFTWSEQLADFATEVAQAERVTLVCNSIGTISGLQAAADRPELFDGVLVVNPNFRELHEAESPAFVMPAVRFVQKALRENGQGIFDALANKATVKNILKEPYHDAAQVTDELVEVLLAPLLTEGAASVVFDTLSYSAGPLPEQLLADARLADTPVWVCHGEQDPWTPNARVAALDRFAPVEKVQALKGVGHCPHDEAPELVNPLIVEFLERVAEREWPSSTRTA